MRKISFLQVSLMGLAVLFASCEGDKPNNPEPPIENPGIERIIITPSSVDLYEGETVQFTLSAYPEDITDYQVRWTTTDETVATIDEEGLLTALSEGQVNVIADVGDGVRDTSEVRVSANEIPVNPGLESITVIPSSLELLEGETAQLNVQVTPASITDYTVRWSVSDHAVATVSSEGLVTALAAGTATITAVAGEGISDEITVTVTSDEIPVSGTPRIGDFFYSDGSWSSTYNSAKKVVGIVFWTGDPTAHDAALKADYPECTNGLAIGLHEVQTAWQQMYELYQRDDLTYGFVGNWVTQNTEYESTLVRFSIGSQGMNLNSMHGYNNTEALIAFNSQPANRNQWPVNIADACLDYRDEVALPKNTSPWYIPSLKEMVMMVSETYHARDIYLSTDSPNEFRLYDMNNLYTLNTSLYAVSGAHDFCSQGTSTNYGQMGFYIGSNDVFDSAARCACVTIGTGNAASYTQFGNTGKNSGNTITRFIFAF